jgi:hypothetical protein
MKKPIDIEKLLQWTVRDEIPKGLPVSAEIGVAITRRGRPRMFSVAANFVERGSVDSFGFVPGSPHADALIVSDAIRDLETSARFNEASEVLPLFGEWRGIAGDAVTAIMSAVFDPRSIVISKAAQSSRPKWHFECPTPYRMMIPFRDAAGAHRDRPLVHGTDADGDIIYLQPRRGRAAMRDGVYDFTMSPRSPLQWGKDPSMISVGHARAEYVAWYGALITLAKALKGKLAEYEPTAPALMPMPWITGQTPASRVLSDGRPPVLLTVRLPLAPKRKAPGRPVESGLNAKAAAPIAKAPATRGKQAAAAE